MKLFPLAVTDKKWQVISNGVSNIQIVNLILRPRVQWYYGVEPVAARQYTLIPWKDVWRMTFIHKKYAIVSPFGAQMIAPRVMRA